MKWSLAIGRISGIKVFIHWTFLILIAWITFISFSRGKNINETLWTTGFYLTLFFCVFLHELGHALAAKKYNIKTRDITILPIGGLARLESMPQIPRQELWVAIAGPLVNVAIAAILAVPVFLGDDGTERFSIVSINADNFLSQVLIANIVLFLFNLIPAFPMDGGRILRALLAMRMPRPKATKIAASIGQFLAIGFVLVGFFNGNFMLIFIGLFIYLGAQSESGYTEAVSSLEGYSVRDIVMKDFKTLDKNEPLSEAVRMLLNGQSRDFLIMDNNEVVGTLNRNEMIKGLSAMGSNTPVETIMNTNIRYVNVESSLEEVIPLTQQKETTFFPVRDENNKLVGVIDSENIMEFMMVRKAVNHF